MTEETRPGFLANYKIVRPGPARSGWAGPARNLKNRPGPGQAWPAFGPARLTPLVQTTEYRDNNANWILITR